MLWTAYFDESGLHAPDGSLVKLMNISCERLCPVCQVAVSRNDIENSGLKLLERRERMGPSCEPRTGFRGRS